MTIDTVAMLREDMKAGINEGLVLKVLQTNGTSLLRRTGTSRGFHLLGATRIHLALRNGIL